MEHRLTLQHSLNAIDIEIVFVEGQKKKVETNWSNWELRSNQTDWGFMHNLFLHSTYLFIETKHFHIVRNCLKITIEWDIEVKPNWLVHAGSLRHNTSISNIKSRAKHKHTFTNKSTHQQIYNCTQIYAIIMQHWLQELLQSHPNIPLSITFLYVQLHTPSSYISSPSTTTSDLQFSIPRFSRRPPPRIMIAFALTS